MIEFVKAYHQRRRPGWRVLDISFRTRDRVLRAAGVRSGLPEIRTDILRLVSASAGTRADIAPAAEPIVSLILVPAGDHELDRRTLAALAVTAESVPLEVIVATTLADGRRSSASSPPAVPSVAAVNRALSTARGRFAALVRGGTLLGPTWFWELMSLMNLDPSVAVTGGRTVSRRAILISAGATVSRDGSFVHIGAGDDPSREEYLARRTVDALTDTAILVRGAAARSGSLLDEAYASLDMAVIDLCLAAPTRGERTVYEPAALAVVTRPSAEASPDAAGVERKHDDRDDAARITGKWGGQLGSGVLGTDVSLSPSARRRTLPRILVCVDQVPASDRDSGGHRMAWILRLLESMSSTLTLVPSYADLQREYVRSHRDTGIEVIQNERLGRFLKRRVGFYDIAILSRVDVAHEALVHVRGTQPQATVVFDTVDLQSVRAEREVHATGASAAGTPSANRLRELRLVHACDVTAAITEPEAELLRRWCPGADVMVLPNVHAIPESPAPGFDARRHLLFIGSFAHSPNADAVRWFARSILPLIRVDLDVRLLVVGPGVSPGLAVECGPYVRFLGWVPDPSAVFDSARVFVAPLRYGAGMKGKVGQAFALGVPVVSTECGAEGMDLADGVNVLVREQPADFARAVVELHADRALWERLADCGRAVVRDRWAPEIMRGRLEQLVSRASAARFPDEAAVARS